MRIAVVLLLSLAVAGCIYFEAQELRLTGHLDGLPLDDSWIHLQFASSLALGDGLSFRNAEWVGGSTGPLWTAALSLAFLLPGSEVHWAKFFGLLCFLGTVVGTVALARVYGLNRRFAVFAGLLLLSTDWMIWSALSGMEISLFLLLSTWGLVFHQLDRARDLDQGANPKRTARAWLLLVASALARPEGLLLVALATLDRSIHFEWRGGALRVVWSGMRASVWSLGLLTLLVLPIGLFHLAAHGSPFPTTLSIKTDAANQWLPSLRDFWRAGEILFRPQPIAFFFSAVGVVALLEGLRHLRQHSLLPALWLVALPMSYSALSAPGAAMNVGNFGRYLFPLFVPLVLLGTIGLERAIEPLRFIRVRRRIDTTFALLLVVLLPTLRALPPAAARYALNVDNVNSTDVAAGRWIARNLPPDSRLAVQDIGAIGLLAPQDLIDMVGIVNPEILPFTQGDQRGAHPSGLQGLFEFLRDRRVDFLVLFPESYGGWTTLREIAPDLSLVHRFEIANNITMAGSELAILLTPWSRYAPQASSQSQ